MVSAESKQCRRCRCQLRHHPELRELQQTHAREEMFSQERREPDRYCRPESGFEFTNAQL
jgi:hypothetical protein